MCTCYEDQLSATTQENVIEAESLAQLPIFNDDDLIGMTTPIAKKRRRAHTVIGSKPPSTSSPASSTSSVVTGSDDPEGQSDDLTGDEVLSYGQVLRAPLPMAQVVTEEATAKCTEGQYFIEFLRNKLTALTEKQNLWLIRACNHKYVKHVEAQESLKEFLDETMQRFEIKYGNRDESITGKAMPRRWARGLKKATK